MEWLFHEFSGNLGFCPTVGYREGLLRTAHVQLELCPARKWCPRKRENLTLLSPRLRRGLTPAPPEGGAEDNFPGQVTWRFGDRLCPVCDPGQVSELKLSMLFTASSSPLSRLAWKMG